MWSWQLDNDLLALLAALWVSYVVCWAWLRRICGRASVEGLIYWSLGLLVVSIALMSAIDTFADTFFSVHMGQHVLLMYVAAPLLLLGRPLSVWQVAFARGSAEGATRAYRWRDSLVAGLNFLLRPPVAWGLATATLCFWHLPPAFDYALVHPNVHQYVEHTTMFFAFLLWWHPLIGSTSRLPYLAAQRDRLLYLVAGMAPAMLLGLVILFWPHVIYAYYLTAPGNGGIPPMLDQQLGALVMLSVGMEAAYLIALPWLFQTPSSAEQH